MSTCCCSVWCSKWHLEIDKWSLRFSSIWAQMPPGRSLLCDIRKHKTHGKVLNFWDATKSLQRQRESPKHSKRSDSSDHWWLIAGVLHSLGDALGVRKVAGKSCGSKRSFGVIQEACIFLEVRSGKLQLDHSSGQGLWEKKIYSHPWS